jgi:vacuolar-type H+-ATPase subunit C/Vma6
MSEIEFRDMLRERYKKMLLTKKETANELNISQATLDRLRKSGQIKSKKVMGSIMFSLDEIARFLHET